MLYAATPVVPTPMNGSMTIPGDYARSVFVVCLCMRLWKWRVYECMCVCVCMYVHARVYLCDGATHIQLDDLLDARRG